MTVHWARTSPWESLCEDFGGPDRVDILHSLAAAPLKRKLAPPRRCLVSSNCKSVPAPSDIVSAAPILKKSSNRLSSLNCWRLSVPRYLSCSNALRAAKNFKTGARARSARMPPTSRLLQCVSMPAAIGTKSFLLIGVASLLHAKAIGTPLIRLPGDWNIV